MCVNFISELCLPAAKDIATYSLSLSACRRSVSPCLSLSVSVSVSGRVAGCESFKSFLAWFFRQKPAAPDVRCTQRADEATTDGQTDDEEPVNWDRLFLAPLDVIHPVAGNLIFLLVVVLMDVIHPTAGKNLVSSVVPMDVLHPVAGNKKISFCCCSHGCHPSCRRKQKKFLFVVDVIHPVAGNKNNSFCCGCHPSYHRNIHFFHFCSSHGCYSSILLQKHFLFLPPFLLFPWMSSILSPKEINSLFGTLGQIICCTHWMSSLLSHRTFFLIT